jgi:hypothetical protein
MTREDWLIKAVDAFGPMFKLNKLEIPPVKVSCGFPSKGALSKTRRSLGECWHSTCTMDGTKHIFVTPILGDAEKVLAVLTHELIHAALPDGEKHGPKFKAAMKAIGLEGKPSATVPTRELLDKLEAMAEELGDYPNPALKPEEQKERKPQAKKSFKMFCEHKRGCDKKCQILDKAVGTDYSISVTRKALKQGFPLCPCGHEMVMEEEDFAEYKKLEEAGE